MGGFSEHPITRTCRAQPQGTARIARRPACWDFSCLQRIHKQLPLLTPSPVCIPPLQPPPAPGLRFPRLLYQVPIKPRKAGAGRAPSAGGGAGRRCRRRFAFYGHLATVLARRRSPEPAQAPGRGKQKQPEKAPFCPLRGLQKSSASSSPHRRSCRNPTASSPTSLHPSQQRDKGCRYHQTHNIPPCPQKKTHHTTEKESQQPLGIFFSFFCCISYIIQFHILIGSAII